MKLMIIIAAVIMSGCVLSQPMPQPQCPNYPDTALLLDVPPPIPDSVHISIEPGRPARANEGGRELLREYVNLRQRIQAWRNGQH